MSETGRLLSVSKTTLGSTLAADASLGDGLVFVTDTSDFDETGGTLSLGGTTYDYTAVDPDTGEITLSGTLAADADDGDRVDVWDVGADQAAEEGRALIDLPGRLANDEPVVADIAHSLMAFVDEGLREPGTEEAVVFERRSGDSWTVTDVRGKRAKAKPGAGAVDASAFAYTSTPQPMTGSVALDGLDVVRGDADRYFDLDTGTVLFLESGWHVVAITYQFADTDDGDIVTASASGFSSNVDSSAPAPPGGGGWQISNSTAPFYAEAGVALGVVVTQHGGSSGTVMVGVELVRLNG